MAHLSLFITRLSATIILQCGQHIILLWTHIHPFAYAPDHDAGGFGNAVCCFETRQHFGRVSKNCQKKKKRRGERFHSVSFGCPKSATSYIIVKISWFWSNLLSGHRWQTPSIATIETRRDGHLCQEVRERHETRSLRFDLILLLIFSWWRSTLSTFPGKKLNHFRCHSTFFHSSSIFETHIINFHRIYDNLSSATRRAYASPDRLPYYDYTSRSSSYT